MDDRSEQEVAPFFRVWLCGAFRVERRVGEHYEAIRTAEWGGSNYPRLLLKALLCCPGRQGRREALIELLWPDADFEQAVLNFNTATTKLRAALRPTKGQESLLLTEQDASVYRLADQQQLWVDIEEALVLLREAECLGRQSPQSVNVLEEAVKYLSRGAFLEDEEGLWLYGRRKDIKEALYNGRRWLAEAYVEQGMIGQAELQWRALLTDDPTDEDILRQAMMHFHRYSMAAKARRLYQQIVEQLAEEDLKLSRETQAFVQRLHDDPLASSQDKASPLQVASSVSPFLLSGEAPEHSQSHLQVGAGTSGILSFPSSIIRPERSLESTTFDNIMQCSIALAQMITLIQHWYGMALFSRHLQNQLDQEMKKLDVFTLQYPLEVRAFSRRSMLFALASLPATLLISREQLHKVTLDLEEFIPQCAASITACWHLSKGGHLETIPLLIDSYLPTLIAVMDHVPSYREVIADLIGQGSLLKSILAWHLESLVVAEAYCVQATHYSLIAHNHNLRLTALNQHALIFYYAGQFEKALTKSEEAWYMLQQTSDGHIFPIMQSRVCMYLAAFQAHRSKGNAEQTLGKAQEALALQTTTVEPIPPYIDCGEASLTLWDGLTHYHLGMYTRRYAKRALASLNIFGQLQPNPDIPERFRLECLTNRTLAAIRANEMEEAISCLTAGQQGARLLESKQRTAEITDAYQELVKRWPQEAQIRKLHAYFE